MAERGAERGFGLLELVVCTALLIAGCVLALALLPGLVRDAQAQLMRDAAGGVARNAIERVRAATAYYPAAAVADPAARAVTTSNHAWALAFAASYTAAVRVRRALCGAAGTTTDVAMAVALRYDAPSDTLTVAVTYPPDPCRTSVTATLSLATQLAPSAYAPQTELSAAIADPALQ